MSANKTIWRQKTKYIKYIREAAASALEENTAGQRKREGEGHRVFNWGRQRKASLRRRHLRL